MKSVATANCEKSAEVIVLSKKCERKWKYGLAAICHKAERRIHKEAAVLNLLTGKHMK